MSAFRQAQEEMGKRLNAVMDLTGEEEGNIQTAVALPSDLVRSMVSGFVPVEDTDDVLAFLDELGDATMTAFAIANGPAARKANVMMTGAQLIALGVALGRLER